MPTFTITSVEDGQGELKVQGNMATSCAEGDFLAGASNQVLVYSSTSPTGGEDVDHLVASGTFDLSGDPLIIPNGGRAVTLRFGEQHYFRTAKDLDLKGLSVRPSFDRGSQSSVTSKSSTNSPMTIASSTSSNANQEAQDEQAGVLLPQGGQHGPVDLGVVRLEAVALGGLAQDLIDLVELLTAQAGLVADGAPGLPGDALGALDRAAPARHDLLVVAEPAFLRDLDQAWGRPPARGVFQRWGR